MADWLNSLTEALASQKHIGPQGTQEAIIPDWLKYLNGVFGPRPTAAAYTNPNGDIYYKSGSVDPTTQAHEQIHAAQYKQANQLSPEAVQGALAPTFGGTAAPNPSHNNLSAMEIPAYLFTDPSRFAYALPMPTDRQTSMNNYLDANAKLNPNTASSLDAAMPNNMLWEYIKNHPRPIGLPAKGVL